MDGRIPDTTADLESRVDYLRKVIVPQIDARVRQGRKKTSKEIRDKLNQEYAELERAIELRYTPLTCLAEIADVVYYSAQLESPPALQEALDLASAFGVPPRMAVEVSIIKYTRRGTGEKNDDAEKELLACYVRGENISPNFDYCAALEKLSMRER